LKYQPVGRFWCDIALKSLPSQLTDDLTVVEWARFQGLAALLCLPAMALALVAGLKAHYPPAGIVAAGGALTVGFSSFRVLHGSRLLPMLLTSFGMFFAASLGTLSGQSHVVTVLLAGLLGLGYGITTVFSEDGSWIGMQCTIAFLVASAFPASGWHALERGALVFAGGGMQVILLLIFQRIPFASPRMELRRCYPAGVAAILWRDLRVAVLQHLHFDRPGLRYAARLSFTLMLAVLVSRLLHQVNSYWLPMTALIVTKPDFYRTYTSSLGRVFGTFAGIGVASFLADALHPGIPVLVVLTLVFAWATFAWQKVNYAIFSCALTAFIVFLIAIAGLPEATVTANRLLDTALGTLIAMGSRAIGPRWASVMFSSPSAAVNRVGQPGDTKGTRPKT
jgi:hypothetical protein